MPAEPLPPIGLGTLRNTDPEECAETVATAIDLGYRHIDTAQKYDNEAYVGDGIARADVAPEELFVGTKIAEENLAHDDVLRTARESLDRLGLETVDLLYIHWPAVSGAEDQYDPAETIPAFNRLYDEGAFRYFGVGNHSVELMEEIDDLLEVPIFANQVEMHPLLQQAELVDYAQATDTYLVAYCPLLRGDVGEVDELVEIAEKHGVTPAQISLAWLASKDNVLSIPKARGAHLRENLEAGDVELDPEDLASIDAIERERRIVDREKGPWHW